MKRIFACVVLILVVTALALPTFAVEGIQVEDSLHVSAETIEDIQKEFRLQNIENAYKVYNVYILSAFGVIECNSIIDALESGAVHGEIYALKTEDEFSYYWYDEEKGEWGRSDDCGMLPDDSFLKLEDTSIPGAIAPDVEVYETHLMYSNNYEGMAICYVTNHGEYIYYRWHQIGERLFPLEAFVAYQKAVHEVYQRNPGLIGGIDTSEMWDLSVYDFRSDSFDLDAPIPEGLLSAGTAPSEKTDIPWYAIGIGIGVCGIAAVMVIVSVRIRKRKG